jgi:hypothetical protein
MYGIYFWNRSPNKALSVVTLITLLIIRWTIAGSIRVYYRALSRVTGRVRALYLEPHNTAGVFFSFETGRGLVKKKRFGRGLVKKKTISRC